MAKRSAAMSQACLLLGYHMPAPVFDGPGHATRQSCYGLNVPCKGDIGGWAAQWIDALPGVSNAFKKCMKGRAGCGGSYHNRVEHNLGEKITFFHMDYLASEVRLNVDFDLTLTVGAHLLYQCFARRLKGFETATPANLYRKFINTPGRVAIAQRELNVIFDKRSHNPILVEAGFERPTPPIRWCGGLRLRMIFP